MSFYKQLGAIFTLFLFLALVVGGVINVSLAKEFMKSYSENTSKNIIVTIKDLMAKKAGVLEIEKEVEFYFKDSEYRSIVVYDEDGKIVVSKYSQERPRTPKFFSWLFPLDNLKTEEKLFEDKENLAQVELVVLESVAQEYLWSMLVKSLLWFVVLSLVFFGVLKLFSIKMLGYISSVRDQMLELSKRSPIKVEEIPSTTEFLQLRASVNQVAESVQKSFEEEKKTKQAYYELLYKDEATKLYNRKYFMSQINNYIGAKAIYSQGIFAIFSFAGMDIAKEKLGFKNLEKLLIEISHDLEYIAKEFENSIVARMNDNDFSIIIPSTDFDTAKPYLEKSFRNIRRTFKSMSVKDSSVYISAGVILYDESDNVGTLFSKADYALSNAKVQGRHYMYLLEDYEHRLFLGKEQWKELISSSMEEESLVLYTQKIFLLESEYAQEFFIRLEKDEKTYPANAFLPVLSNFNLLKNIDKYVLEKFDEKVFSQEVKGVFCLNISASFVMDTVMNSWFKTVFTKTKAEGKVVCFESSLSDVLQNPLIYQEFCNLLNFRGLFFGIDNYYLEEDYTQILQDFVPKYIKIDKESVLFLTEKEEEVFAKTKERCNKLNIDMIVTNIEKEKEKRSLVKLDIKTLQGRLFDKEKLYIV